MYCYFSLYYIGSIPKRNLHLTYNSVRVFLGAECGVAFRCKKLLGFEQVLIARKQVFELGRISESLCRFFVRFSQLLAPQLNHSGYLTGQISARKECRLWQSICVNKQLKTIVESLNIRAK